ncbi:MAG: ABC transporter ATP-binding protein [Chloroflexia bacterium]|nr:ABC transporter ATP-binding protein [Chloroflexia bacterium]
MPPIIEVENLVKRYKKAETNAVDGIWFTVEPGQLFALLGPNGAGKTTTISILTTTLALTAGSVRIAGHDITREASAVRQRVGIIFQKPSLDLNLSGEENVRFHAVLYGLYPWRPTYRSMPAAYRRQVADLASVVGIEGEIFRPVKTLSGGQQRKLEIVRSLIHSPKVLFLDEPTAGLDPASRRGLWKYLTDARAHMETTVFLTTHYLEEAEQADCICVINRGAVAALGTAQHLKAELVESEYLLVDAADRPRLLAELESAGLRHTQTPPFRVDLDRRSVHQVLRSIETPLTVVRTHAPTLEDAYLSIVDEPQEEPA